jgi:hypothetical protein
MLPKIIIANDPDQRRQQSLSLITEITGVSFHPTHPDFTIVKAEKEFITIQQVRLFNRQLVIKPYQSQNKVYIFEDVWRLTLSAQQALLKSLEEPPDFALIILETNQLQSILPTIVSRCETISLFTDAKFELTTEQQDRISALLKSSPGQIINWLSTNRFTKTDYLDLINQLRYYWSANLSESEATKYLRQIQTANNRINYNVNPSLVIFNLLTRLRQ